MTSSARINASLVLRGSILNQLLSILPIPGSRGSFTRVGVHTKSSGLALLETLSHQPSISKMASISTAMLRGSDPMPTALRAPIPLSSPNTSTNNSLHPLITFG